MIRRLRRLIRPFWNPIVEKELRSRMRTGRASLLISLYVVTLAGVGYFTYVIVRRQAYGGVANGQLSIHAGVTIFRALTIWEMVLVLFIAPALTAAAIAVERERQTLDLLLCTRVRPASIVMGKLVASLLFALLLLVASVPVFSMVLLFGGVELSQVVGVAATLGVTAVVIGALGLLCSVTLRRPTGATVFAYIIAFLYLVVPAGTSVMFPALATSRTVQAYAQYSNPIFVLASTLLDTPVRSPSASQQIASGQASFGSTQCTLTSAGSTCFSSGPVVGPTVPTAPPAPLPNRDVIVSGIFHGWRSWQGFAALNAVLVALTFGLTVLVLTKKDARGAYRRKRKAAAPVPPPLSERPVAEAVPVGPAPEGEGL